MRWALAAVVVGIVSGAAQRAEACSCRRPALVPRETDVALNARFLVSFGDPAAVTLRTEAGDLVPVEVVSARHGLIISPSQRLTPDTSYFLQVDDLGTSFRTGATLDEAAPRTPTLGSFTRSKSPLFGPFGTNCVLEGGETFAVAIAEPGFEGDYVEVFTGPSTSAIDVSSPALVIPVAQGPMTAIGFGDGVVCGPHLGTSSMPDLAIQVRAVDLAGNASELSNAIQLKTGGCSTSGGTALALAAILLVRGRRRRG